MSTDRAAVHGRGIRRRVMAKGLAGNLVHAVILPTVVAAAMATAPTATTDASASARIPVKKPTTTAAASLIRRSGAEVRAAEGLSARLTRSDAAIATASLHLRALSAQAGPLLVNLSATRTAQATAETDATVQSTRLVELRTQVQLARSSLEHSAINSYVGGGGPLGEMAVALESLAPSVPDGSIDPLATVNLQVNQRAKLFNRANSARSAQVTRSSRAISVSKTATAAATTSAKANSAHASLVDGQERLSKRLRAAETAQVGQATGVRSGLLREGNPAARAADRKLAQVLKGRDYKLLMAQSTRCGRGSPIYPNGRWPSRARCPLYAAPDQTLRRAAAFSFNRMSNAYQQQTGSALCVTEGYRSYAEQVAVKKRLPGLAATPGTSKHGLGLAVDLCGGVQDFASPAHRWLKSHARRFGWFHPAWAEPSGGLPEAWHWEFAG